MEVLEFSFAREISCVCVCVYHFFLKGWREGLGFGRIDVNKFAYVSVFTFIEDCRMESFVSETPILIFRRDECRYVGDYISVEHSLIERKKFYLFTC